MRGMPARIALVLATALLFAARPAAAQSCDRACLTGIVSVYLSAMTAHDPSRVPVADRVRVTEDTKVIALGDGLWKNITTLRPTGRTSSMRARAWPPRSASRKKAASRCCSPCA
jgi:hypothetical protein